VYQGVQVQAAEILGKLNNSSAVGPLIQTLKDEDPGVRYEAAIALGKLNDTRAVGPLIRVLETDKEPGIRSVAADSLGNLHDTRAVEPLTQALKDNVPTVQLAAGEALDKLNITFAG
jgi:HEAT repeat protein